LVCPNHGSALIFMALGLTTPDTFKGARPTPNPKNSSSVVMIGTFVEFLSCWGLLVHPMRLLHTTEAQYPVTHSAAFFLRLSRKLFLFPCCSSRVACPPPTQVCSILLFSGRVIAMAPHHHQPHPVSQGKGVFYFWFVEHTRGGAGGESWGFVLCTVSSCTRLSAMPRLSSSPPVRA